MAALAALTTAVTTGLIHRLPETWAMAHTFDHQLDLRSNPYYTAYCFVVIVHCILVVVSMYAICLLRFHATPGLIGLGFIFFLAFGFFEMTRTSLNYFALNQSWRSAYVTTTDNQLRESFRAAISAWGGIDDALFFLFYLGFTTGLLCYGLALWTSSEDWTVGALLLAWAALNIPELIHTVTGRPWISAYFAWVGPYFQPPARLVIALWLWKKTLDTRPVAT